jgi:hypothetical protein
VIGGKYTYVYDGNNNRIESLSQLWEGSNWVNELKVSYDYTITAIEQVTDIIKSYSLSNNYPNPFNPSSTIQYSIPQSELVIIKVYDMLGSEVATLTNEYKIAGTYEINFDGSRIASGVYFYQLRAGNFVETKKMVLMK